MKKHFYGSIFILLSLIITGCQFSRLSQLEATNAALSTQVNSLRGQATQQAVLPLISNQQPGVIATESIGVTQIPMPSPSSPPPTIINSALIVSGSGTLTPWTNKTSYPNVLFGAANVHMLCDPNGMADGKMYIDKETETATCAARGESWTPWKQDITIGDHYIYSSNANDKYEFWTIGTTPFTIRNTYSHSDFIFMVNKTGIYTLSANLIKGEFNVYITCQEAQNYDYRVNQSASYEVVILKPATCMLLIRDVEQAKTSLADIEVSLEFTR
jgi:hypothetical protein